MTEETYTDRRAAITAVKSKDKNSITREDGWSQGVPADVIDLLEVGVEYAFETYGFNWISGIQEDNGNWFYRKSDQDFDREHQKFVDDLAVRREEEWAKFRDDYAAREAALPEALRRRLERFRANGGHDFELSGWGYELIICELALLYVDSGGEDDDEIDEFARQNGTTGNQHGFAKALAKYLAVGNDDVVANSISALSPITGDVDYSGEGGA